MSQEPSTKTVAMMIQTLDDRYNYHLCLDDLPPISTTLTTVFQSNPQHSLPEPLSYTTSSFLPWADAKYTASPTATMFPWSDAQYHTDSMGMNASDSSGTSSDSSLSLHSERIFRQNDLLNGLRTWTKPDVTSNGNLKASRCVLVRNIASHVSVQDMLDTIKLFGDVKLAITERMQVFHELLVVYHDIRHAQILVLRVSLASQMTDPLYGTWATYCFNNDVIKRYAITLPPGAEFMVKVDGYNLKAVSLILSSYGDLQNLCQYEISQSQSTFVGEFFDERCMIKAVDELQGITVQDLHFEFHGTSALRPLSNVPPKSLYDESVLPLRLEHTSTNVSQPTVTKYGSTEQQSIDNFLQMLNTFRSSSINALLEELEPIADDSQQDTVQKNVSQVSTNEIDIDRILMGLDKRTTCMIRNIPNKYTQQMLIECINSTHQNEYDFLYLRIDFKNKCNVGYAFINFIELRSLVTFAQQRVGKKWQVYLLGMQSTEFTGFKKSRFNSEKRCTLSYANIQGKKALIDKFRNSSVMDEEISYQPKIFVTSGEHRGEEEPFPLPTVPSDIRKRKQRHTLTVKSHRSSSFLDYYHHADGINHGDVQRSIT